MKILILMAALLLAGPVFAADGAKCADSLRTDVGAPGKYNIVCFMLCDTHKDADNDAPCTQFDLMASGKTGMPSKLLIEMTNLASACTALSVDINHGNVSGGVEHDLGTITSSTTALAVPPSYPLGRFLNTDVIDTNCTDLDVILWAYYERKQ